MSRKKVPETKEQLVDGVVTTTKKCVSCGEFKELSCYSKRAVDYLGLARWCKECDRIKQGSVRRASPAQIINRDDQGRIVSAVCTGCRALQPASHFRKDSGRQSGISHRCSNCANASRRAEYVKNRDKFLTRNKMWQSDNMEYVKDYRKSYYERNRDKISEQSRAYREANEEKLRESSRRYRIKKKEWLSQRNKFRRYARVALKRDYDINYRELNRDSLREKKRTYYQLNPDVSKAAAERRRAFKVGMPANWNADNLKNPTCALTGVSKVYWDHFIPLASGHGGTYLGNMVPLFPRLNASKYDHNPFEWFEANRQRFELDQSRFDTLVWRLASQNGLTPEEFRRFTYWCFDNPRTVEQIAEDNARYGIQKPSLEIWREQTGLPFPIAVDFGDTALNNDITRKEDAA